MSVDLFNAFCWWIMISFRLEAHQDRAQSERIESLCPGWARFLKRRADKKARIADVYSHGDKNTYRYWED